MVKRAEFERELISIVAPAINRAQDVLEAKYGVRFEVNVDWHLTKGKFEDEPPKGSGIGG